MSSLSTEQALSMNGSTLLRSGLNPCFCAFLTLILERTKLLWICVFQRVTFILSASPHTQLTLPPLVTLKGVFSPHCHQVLAHKSSWGTLPYNIMHFEVSGVINKTEFNWKKTESKLVSKFRHPTSKVTLVSVFLQTYNYQTKTDVQTVGKVAGVRGMPNRPAACFSNRALRTRHRNMSGSMK